MKEIKIWESDVAVATHLPDQSFMCMFQSLRIAGSYKIPIDDGRYLNYRCNQLSRAERDRVKARLGTVLLDRRVGGEEAPLVDKKLIDYAIEIAQPLPVAQRARRLLKLMTHHEEGVHVAFFFSVEKSLYEIGLGVSESINEDELRYFLSYLRESGLIKASEPGSGGYVASVQGHELVHQETMLESSNKVFIAMWFGIEMNSVWFSINSAVETAGYEPRRIDYGDHSGLIDDAIISEIREAKFLIVDLTHGEEGQRGSVYYEAGFGRGLNKPVIQTVRQDHLDDDVPNLRVAFDLNHYPVIPWSQDYLQDFEKALLKRIKSRFGEFTPVRN